jgi:multidrug efflux pump subunit AcrB
VSLDQLTKAWLTEIGEIPGIHSLIIQGPGFGPAGVPIEVRIQGENLTRLKEAALEMAAELSGYSGVYNVIDGLRPGKPQIRFRMVEGAHGLGLTADEVANQLRAAMLGEIAATQRSARGKSRSLSARQKKIGKVATIIKKHQEEGLSAAVAAGQASRDRLRAILIATTTPSLACCRSCWKPAPRLPRSNRWSFRWYLACSYRQC